VKLSDGSILLPDGSIEFTDGTVKRPTNVSYKCVGAHPPMGGGGDGQPAGWAATGLCLAHRTTQFDPRDLR